MTYLENRTFLLDLSRNASRLLDIGVQRLLSGQETVEEMHRLILTHAEIQRAVVNAMLPAKEDV